MQGEGLHCIPRWVGSSWLCASGWGRGFISGVGPEKKREHFSSAGERCQRGRGVETGDGLLRNCLWMELRWAISGGSADAGEAARALTSWVGVWGRGVPIHSSLQHQAGSSRPWCAPRARQPDLMLTNHRWNSATTGQDSVSSSHLMSGWHLRPRVSFSVTVAAHVPVAGGGGVSP